MQQQAIGEPRQVALITGASGGIGAELARVFARNGHELALVARNAERLDALAVEIEASGCPRPLTIALDLTRSTACAELAAKISAQRVVVNVLINNAGFGLLGPTWDLRVAQQIEIVDLNIRALTELTLQFLPDLVVTRGRILNVASVASFLPGPGMAIYYASKAYVLSMSEALSSELAPKGVAVSVLCPGVTNTEFQNRAGIGQAWLKSSPGMSAIAVAEAGYKGLMAGRRRIVPGFSNKVMVALLPFVPNGVLLPIVVRLQSRRRIS